MIRIPSTVIDYVLKTGKWAFVCSVLILALHNWAVLDISNIITNILWGYLIINTLGVASIIYRRYNLKSSVKKCPYCSGELRYKLVYICPNCGELKAEK